jgi:hypothetical protein
MAQKLVCNLPNRENNDEPNCTGIVLHKISDKMVQIGRQGKQRFSLVGGDWSLLATCPKCGREHSIICSKGEIQGVADMTLEDIPVEPETPPTVPPADPNVHPAPVADPVPPVPAPAA